MRLITMLMAAAIALLSVGAAHAGSGDPGSSIFEDESKAGFGQGDAYASCMAAAKRGNDKRVAEGYPSQAIACPLQPSTSGTRRSYYCTVGGTHTYCLGPNGSDNDSYHTYSTAKTCLLERGPVGWSLNESLAPNRQTCDDGCTVSMAAADIDERWTINTPGGTWAVGNYVHGLVKPTGAVCSRYDSAPKPERKQAGQDPSKDVCQDAGGGYKTCYTPDNKVCAISPKGTRSCWTPGEIGPKVTPDRTEGASKGDGVIPPTPPAPREGEAWNKTGESSVTNNTTNNTSVVSTYNNGGQKGTDPVEGDGSGATDVTPGTGSGSGGDGEGNESGGGGDCDTPPTSSGDPILGNILKQTWSTRCATEGKITDSGSCETAERYSCSGSKVLCKLTNDQARDRCKREKQDANSAAELAGMAGESDGLEGVTETGLFQEAPGGQINETLVGGGGAGQCAVTSRGIGGHSFSMPAQFWEASGFIKWLMISLAYVWVMYWMVK